MKDQDPREKGTRDIGASILHATIFEESVEFTLCTEKPRRIQQLRGQKSKQGFKQSHITEEAEAVVQSLPRRKGPDKNDKISVETQKS